MKRMTVSDFVRVQGIGKTRIRLRGNPGEAVAGNRKYDGADFRSVFDEEMKRQEGEDGESEEADVETEEDIEGKRPEVGELAGTWRG